MPAVNISPEIETRAARVAKSTGRPVTAVIEAALAEGLDEMEELAIAEDRLEAIHSGTVKAVDLETLINGMDD